MATGVAISPASAGWKELYRAALFETDRSRLSERIAHAEWALALRSQHLFYEQGGHHAERQAVDAALYALFILKSHTIESDMRKDSKSHTRGAIDAAEILRCRLSNNVYLQNLRKVEGSSVQGELKERWYELCSQAAVEQDPQKLLVLVKEINELLSQKDRRLKGLPPEPEAT
jgi:hypothetical protein